MAITDFDSVFWTDPWMRKRTPHARYLFIYLFTCSHKNRAGIYSIDIGVMSFETGMSEEKIRAALKELEPKVLYDYENEIVFVTNHVRHQYAKKNRIAPTISSSIVTDLNKLPEGHDFIHLFIEKYSKYFGLEGTLVVEYEYYHGKGKGRESLKYNDEFEKFWKVYPARNGKKRSKPVAWELFQKFKPEQWPILILCAENYAKSQKARSNFAKDPERFLKKDYWKDWQEPEEEYIEPAESGKKREDIKHNLIIAEDALRAAKETQQFNPSPKNAEWVQVKQRVVNQLRKELDI